VFYERVVEIGPIHDLKRVTEPTRKTHFFRESARGRGSGRLAGPGMAAARIRPESRRVVLAGCPPLDQQPAILVEYKHRKRPVELAFTMRADLLFRANDVVVSIDEGHQVRHHLRVPS
jgi:hypothetical protein